MNLEIQIEVSTNNASAMMSNSLIWLRSKQILPIIDNKRSLEEIREDLDFWLSKEEEDCSKKKREERESEDKEKKQNAEEKKESLLFKEQDLKLKLKDKKKLKPKS